MIKKIIKGATYLLALTIATLFSVFVGSKGVSDYILSHDDSSGGIPVALAEVPVGGDGSGSGAGAGADCGSSSGTGCSADAASADSGGGGADAASADSGSGGAGGDGGGGGKVICTELYRQGLLTKEIWLVDEAFGRQLAITDPDVMLGYHAWAPTVVAWMKSSTIVTAIVSAFALPWAREMAYQMGVTPAGSIFGSVVMRTGISTCRIAGCAARATRLALAQAV